MARKSLRLKVLRMLQGNNGDNIPFEVEQETRNETDQERRIKQWLVESRSPEATVESSKYRREHHQHRARKNATFKPDSHSRGKIIRSDHQSPRQVTGTSSVVTSVLYHPDFADWKACELAARVPPEKHSEPSPEKVEAAYLFRVIDNAQASLTKLLSDPLGGLGACLTDPRPPPK